ncbi:helix-turn-helix transcriptional regulator [Alkalicella caledoniensis]|uniref:Helix-turn-helix transcriptional regulator n=1 Tax=Alkalicella caledoniensis TaxID=2731377 RepID=A0A7G9W6M1_ALKCA|nr:helix-turn-helix transcriptional regulator [Alkalicella caledoniensis]QNO14333.1 helix-turn-helix transcriptional regulator [Alkalicella caledoniensis]
MENKSMGEVISEHRKENDMTQAVLAKRLGVTDKAVSKWERNISCPDISTIPKLAEVLGVSVEGLMQGRENSKNGFQQLERRDLKQIFSLFIKCVAISIGVGTFVLNLLGVISSNDAVKLLSLAVICLGLYCFFPEEKEG